MWIHPSGAQQFEYLNLPLGTDRCFQVLGLNNAGFPTSTKVSCWRIPGAPLAERLPSVRAVSPGYISVFDPISTTALFGSFRKSAAELALWCICAKSFCRQTAMAAPSVGTTVSRARK
ncbi:hypothetical protein SAMN04489708_103156 [Paracidovorax cattleyae]|uniref:Uncharacterized protein n=1 Tax=Paracidovorax cattleyae TaxID=80868 RepID=A0A1H0M802_9BURK|nr:hypothetical protein SAMN04489708_103156 [Paracidovorax cattleyae]